MPTQLQIYPSARPSKQSFLVSLILFLLAFTSPCTSFRTTTKTTVTVMLASPALARRVLRMRKSIQMITCTPCHGHHHHDRNLQRRYFSPSSVIAVRSSSASSRFDDPFEPPPPQELQQQCGINIMPLSILQYPHPQLREPNVDVTKFDEELRSVVKNMFDVMYATDGMGLAAPQVGINKRLMVFNADDRMDKAEECVFVNPSIISRSSQSKLGEEGCLSFPMIYGWVERHTKIAVSYQDLDGKKFEQVLSGKPAVIFQHEYDHLDGVLFIDRMIPRYKVINKRRLMKMIQQYGPGGRE